MLLELFLIYLVSGMAEPAPREPILIAVAAEDIERCQLTLAQVMGGPTMDESVPILALAKQPAREVHCVIEGAEREDAD